MLHKSIVPSDRHAPWSWEFADAAARTGATGFVAADIGKVALQQDNATAWILTSTAPAWAPLGAAATVSWADIAGKPNTFPPSTHTHDAGDLSGVVKSVNGVAPDGSGNVTVSSGGGGGSATILQTTGTLGQGQSLTITHAADPSRKRMVSVVKTITTVSLGPSLIPTMTSNTTPSGTASASSELGVEYAAWKAFDGNIASFFSTATGTLPEWLRYSFTAPVEVAGYSVGRRMNDATTPYGAAYYPTAVRLQYSTDGTNWQTADTQTGLNYESPTRVYTKTFSLAAPVTAQHWRVQCDGAAGSAYFQTHGVALFGAGTTSYTYESASASDYKITYTDTTTVLTRTAAGTETVTMNLLIGA